MSWTPLPPAPIARHDAGPRAPALRIFDGKPHALAFLADGALVVGASHGLTLHDPLAPTPPRASLDVRSSSGPPPPRPEIVAVFPPGG